jgi:hypothetical protein
MADRHFIDRRELGPLLNRLVNLNRRPPAL